MQVNKIMFGDRAEVHQKVAEIKLGRRFVPDLTATVQKVRAMMQAEGICLKDDVFITEMMRKRYE